MAETPSQRAPGGEQGQEAGGGIPHFYANSASFNLTTTEITTAWKFNDKSLAAVSIPFSMAKSLARELSAMVRTYEKMAGHEVRSLEELSFQEKAAEPEQHP